MPIRVHDLPLKYCIGQLSALARGQSVCCAPTVMRILFLIKNQGHSHLMCQLYLTTWPQLHRDKGGEKEGGREERHISSSPGRVCSPESLVLQQHGLGIRKDSAMCDAHPAQSLSSSSYLQMASCRWRRMIAFSGGRSLSGDAYNSQTPEPRTSRKKSRPL